MSLVEKVYEITRQRMHELAETIEGELKAECPVRTGEARNSIGIQEIDDTHIFVGGENLHLYYADQGNKKGSRGGRIYPKGKALSFWGSKSRYVGKHYVVPSVRAYDGAHFVREVADRHR